MQKEKKKKINEIDVPCKECLLIPVCKYKNYGILIKDCDPMYNYLYFGHDKQDLIVATRKHNFDTNIKKLYLILKPTEWKLGPFRPKRPDFKTCIIIHKNHVKAFD
jgi:hypothetical protein